MKNIVLAGLVLALTSYSGLAFAQNVVNYTEQGGARTVIGGELDIVSGGSLEFNGTAITATAEEINRATDVSARLVTLGASESITVAAHDGKTLCFGSAAGTATLPAATGSGAIFKLTACAVPPGAGYVITVTGDDTIDGQFLSAQDAGDTVVGWETASNTDTITFTSSTKGAAGIGAWVELQDIAADQYTVRGQGTSTGSEATPFSGS